MSKETITFNRVNKEFKTALKEAEEGEYVKKPKILNRLKKERRKFIFESRKENERIKIDLEKNIDSLVSQYEIPRLDAVSLVLTSWDWEKRLNEESATFGGVPFNFSLERFELTQKNEKDIVNICENSMKALALLGNVNVINNLKMTGIPFNNVENDLEKLNLSPNAARIDLIITKDGPKIIEINSQWVDAIGVLSGFQNVFGKTGASRKLLESVGNLLPRNSKLAIIDVRQVSGSKETGASDELNRLARKLMNRTLVNQAIVIDPDIVSLDYLDTFDAFYINCDPKIFINSYPKWMALIVKKINNGSTLLPCWRPSLDKKPLLTSLTNSSTDMSEYLEKGGVNINLLKEGIVQTTSLSSWMENPKVNNPVIKGDGYSLNAIAIPGQQNFEEYLQYAKEEPSSYVVQPFIKGDVTNYWVYDTTLRKIKLLKNAYSKINVWVIGGRVVGMMATVSDSPLISDRGYNSLPIVRKGKTS